VHQKIKVVRRAAGKTNIRLFPFLNARRRHSRDLRNDKIVASQRQSHRAGSHPKLDLDNAGIETRMKGYGAVSNGGMDAEAGATLGSTTENQPLLNNGHQ
jgi:hypothetical protein